MTLVNSSGLAELLQIVFVVLIVTDVPLVHGILHQTQKLVASDRGDGDNFGRAVGIDGDLAIVGAQYADSGNDGTVYIFEYNAIYDNWTQVARLKASDGDNNDQLGFSCDIDSSYKYAIAGANWDDDNAFNAGAAYIWEWNETDSSWNEISKIIATDGADSDYFGNAVAIEGTTAVVGAYGYDGSAGSLQGSAYVFERLSPYGWTQVCQLAPSDAQANGYFGISVDISGDLIAVGADEADSSAGVVYIFAKNNSGNAGTGSGQCNWVQVQRLTANDASIDDEFGTDVAIDGNYLAIGARYAGNVGKFYIFESNGSNITFDNYKAFKQVASFQPSLSVSDDFGRSVSITRHGYAICGAYLYDDGDGGAWIYERNDLYGNWSLKSQIAPNDLATDDYFGFSVSMSNNFAIVGSHGDNCGGYSNCGAAYIFSGMYPSLAPSNTPSNAPSMIPTQGPSNSPTDSPIAQPTINPSDSPSVSPSNAPYMAPSTSPTDSPSVAPSDAPTTKPSYAPGNYPTNSPSVEPSTSPSLPPTMTPSSSPSNFPSLSPIPLIVTTIMPTKSPTGDELSSTTSISTSGNENTHGTNSSENGATGKPTEKPMPNPTVVPTQVAEVTWNENMTDINVIGDELTNRDMEILNGMNNITIGLVILGIVILVIVALFKILHNRLYFKGSDAPNYGNVLQYAQSVIDFWTDVMFTYAMYIRNETIYFMASLTFTILPLICSMIMIVYWIFRWRVMTSIVPQRIIDYLKNYSMSLIIFSLIGNFGSTISLVRSKLFLNRLFYFPLKSNEVDNLRVWKFINITLLENIPQIIIQVSYITWSNNDNIDILILFSIVLTCLSLLFAISSTAVTILKIAIDYSKNVLQITKIGVKMTLSSYQLGSKHGFIHDIVEHSLLNTLRTCDGCDLWVDRSDVQLSIELYYINSDRIGMNHEIDCYFELVLTCYNEYNNNNIENRLINVINQLPDSNSHLPHSKVNQSFKQMMNFQANFGHNKQLHVENIKIIYQRTGSKMDDNNIEIALTLGTKNENNNNNKKKNGDGDGDGPPQGTLDKSDAVGGKSTSSMQLEGLESHITAQLTKNQSDTGGQHMTQATDDDVDNIVPIAYVGHNFDQLTTKGNWKD